MAFRGSLSRTLISTARASSLRFTPPLPRLRPPSSPSAPRLIPSRLSFSNPRTLGELGCAQSLLPMLAGVGLTSHIAVNLRAYSELSHGRNDATASVILGLGKEGNTDGVLRCLNSLVYPAVPVLDTPILVLLTSVRRGKPKSPSIIGWR